MLNISNVLFGEGILEVFIRFFLEFLSARVQQADFSGVQQEYLGGMERFASLWSVALAGRVGVVVLILGPLDFWTGQLAFNVSVTWSFVELW